MKYYECPYCGSNLDHGETCDCQKSTPKPKNEAQAQQPTPAQRKERQIA